MIGFKPQTSGIWSNRSTNWATTTAHLFNVFEGNLQFFIFSLLDAKEHEHEQDAAAAVKNR